MRVDVEFPVLPRIEMNARHRADGDTRLILYVDTRFGNYIGHCDRSGRATIGRRRGTAEPSSLRVRVSPSHIPAGASERRATRHCQTPALAAAGSPAPAGSSLRGRENRPDSRVAMRPAKAGAAEPPAEQGHSCAIHRRRLCPEPEALAMTTDEGSSRRGWTG